MRGLVIGIQAAPAAQVSHVAQLAGSSTAPAAPLDTAGWHVAGWMEWEEITLRPAVYGGAPGPLEAALAHLDQYLAGSEFLVGSAPTLADVVVFAGLLPLTIASTVARSPPRQNLGLVMPGEQWHACTGGDMVEFAALSDHTSTTQQWPAALVVQPHFRAGMSRGAGADRPDNGISCMLYC